MDEPSEVQRREFEEKNLAHYSVLLQAWVDTRMEHDRTIVMLSAAGIGLLVTILTTVGVVRWWELLLYAGSFAGLAVAIFVSLRIFQRNSGHIEHAIHGSSNQDPALVRHDKVQVAAFFAGVLLFIAIGVVSAFNKVTGDSKVSEKNSQTSRAIVGDSLNGIGGLGPTDLGKSLSGIGALRPQAPAQQPASASTPAAAPSGGSQPAAAPSAPADGSK